MTRHAPLSPTIAPRFRHAAYGVRILSDISLPELLPDTSLPETAPVLRISRAPLAKPPASGLFLPDQSLFHWETVGSFRVSGDGMAIDCDLPAGISDELAAFPLLGPVLSESLRRRGLFVLHASAVTLDGAAVVLLADKGTGKSTSAAALLRAGARILADDLVAVDADGQILPGFGQLKLSGAAVAAQMPGKGTLRGHVHDAIDKHRILLPQETIERQPTMVSRLYVLHRQAGPGGISPMPAGAGLPAVLRFSYAARFGAALLQGAAAQSHFRHAVGLASRCAPRILHLPDGLEAMNGLADLIRADLAEGGAP